MIAELFINSCILITFISISYIFIKIKDMSTNISFSIKVLIGAYLGLLGVLLMLFSIPIISNVIVDFRYIPILLAAIFAGTLPSIIAAIIIGGFRILYFGINDASLVALIDALLVGIGFSILSATKASRKIKWIYSDVYIIIVTSISFIILIKDKILLFKLLVLYPTALILMSYFVFTLTEYLSESIVIDRKLKSEATVDFLTGLNNLRQFKKDFNNLAQQAMRKKEYMSILFLDIDFFKNVNDTYGHSSGDIVLKNLAIIFRDTCRSFDIISRNGGEEFSILLLDCTLSHAAEIAERIRKNVEDYEFHLSDKMSINLTISIGVSTYPDITNDINHLVEDADNALYKAKRTGRNKVCIYNSNDPIIII